MPGHHDVSRLWLDLPTWLQAALERAIALYLVKAFAFGGGPVSVGKNKLPPGAGAEAEGQNRACT
jgi:hypothetical protein